jgi:two-component system sensor histidine kinase CpxA
MGGLFLRIFLWFWLGFTCLLLVFAGSILVMRPDILDAWRSLNQSAVLALGAHIADAYERGGPGALETALSDVERTARLRAWLYAADGGALGRAAPLGGSSDLIAQALSGDEVERASGTGTFLLARRVSSRTGTSYVFVWESPIRSRLPLPGSRLQFWLRVGALILTAGVLCWWFTWQITRPLRILRGAARRVSQGDLSVRISDAPALRRGDELSELAREFDHMAARVEQLLTSQQQLLADISHELRSPLARLSLALDLARRRTGEGVPEHDRIALEIQRLNESIEQLLTLARLQGPPTQARPDQVDLRELVREVVQDARFEAEARGRRVEVTADCAASVRGSRPLLRSAVENVVRNAVRHAPERSAVEVAMTRQPDPPRLSIVVRDRGPGVPTHALGRLFDPFYRVEEARDRDSGGVGLGLAIVRQAMLAHGGEASASNHPGGGLAVRLDLPVDP